jgi:hypothetical protein
LLMLTVMPAVAWVYSIDVDVIVPEGLNVGLPVIVSAPPKPSKKL